MRKIELLICCPLCVPQSQQSVSRSFDISGGELQRAKQPDHQLQVCSFFIQHMPADVRRSHAQICRCICHRRAHNSTSCWSSYPHVLRCMAESYRPGLHQHCGCGSSITMLLRTPYSGGA